MATVVTYDNIVKAYSSVAYKDDQKDQVRGQPSHKNFYDVRLINWLYTFQQARLGDVFAQVAMRAVPYVGIRNNNLVNVTVTHNNEKFSFAPSDLIPMRQNEAYFFIEQSTNAGTPLTQVPITDYFAAGKPNFVYW